jgi:L-lysine exporter family protein LysE/ArgO
MFHLFINGFVLGFLSSPTCPSNAEEVRWGSAHGFPAALLVGLGAVTGDALILFLVLLGLYPLLQAFPGLERALWLVGSLVLAYLAWGILREAAATGAGAARPVETARSQRFTARPFTNGLLITALNPFTVAWWVGLLGSSATPAGTLPLPFAAAVLAGSLAWFGGLAALLQLGQSHFRLAVRRGLLVAGGLVLLGYAAWLASRVLAAI